MQKNKLPYNFFELISPEICRRLLEQQPRFYIPKFWAFFVTPPVCPSPGPLSRENSLSWLSINLRTKKPPKRRTCSSVALFFFSLPRKFGRFHIRFSSPLQKPILYLDTSRGILQGFFLTALLLVLFFLLLYWSAKLWTKSTVSDSGLVSAWPHTPSRRQLRD